VSDFFDNMEDIAKAESRAVSSKFDPTKVMASAMSVKDGFMKHAKGIGIAATVGGVATALVSRKGDDDIEDTAINMGKNAAMSAGLYVAGIGLLKGKSLATGYWSSVQKNRANVAAAKLDEVTNNI
jgi:hypothetical protein